MAPPLHPRPLRPRPSTSPRPWAGTRLAAHGDGVGELWLAGPASVVTLDDGRDLTLDELAAAHGERLVGERGLALIGARFPLLVKLIDAADWLSLQVHPDDALARELYGPAAVGKTEAWLVLDADAGAELVVGPRRSLHEADLRAAIAAGALDRAGCEVVPAVPGDTFLLVAGTLHAIGAGLFVYEIEQPSDLTFRVSDWGRPSVPGRSLHIDEAGRAVRPDAAAVPAGTGYRLDGGELAVPEFRLETLPGPGRSTRTPAGHTVEVITTARGSVTVRGDGWEETLGEFETVVVPALVQRYEIDVPPDALACIGSVP